MLKDGWKINISSFNIDIITFIFLNKLNTMFQSINNNIKSVKYNNNINSLFIKNKSLEKNLWYIVI